MCLEQLEKILAGKGGWVNPVHFKYLLEAKSLLEEGQTELPTDTGIILSVYRDTVRYLHLNTLNKDHPKYREKSEKRERVVNKSFYKSAAYREKLSKAQKGKKRSPEQIAKTAAKNRESWARKRAAKKATD